MKTVICGGRDFDDYDLLINSINSNITEVVCGKAHGADSLGEKYAIENNIQIEYFPANWSLGKGAGFIRNEQMAIYADICIAFWDGKSKGTKHMIDTMKKLNKPFKVVYYNIDDPFEDF